MTVIGKRMPSISADDPEFRHQHNGQHQLVGGLFATATPGEAPAEEAAVEDAPVEENDESGISHIGGGWYVLNDPEDLDEEGEQRKYHGKQAALDALEG